MHDPLHTFAVDGVAVPLLAGVELSQAYETLGGRTLLRMRGGRGLLQSHWQRLKTELAGSGWLPAALAGLDESLPHTLDCAAPRALQQAGPLFALPPCRPDVAPLGFALLGDAEQEVAVSLSGATASLAPVPGAAGYRLLYWPRLTGFVTVSEQADLRGALFGWTVTLEEQ